MTQSSFCKLLKRHFALQQVKKSADNSEFALLPAARWHWHRNGLSTALIEKWPRSGPKGHITKSDVLQNIARHITKSDVMQNIVSVQIYKFLIPSTLAPRNVVDAAVSRLEIVGCKYTQLADFGGQIEFRAKDGKEANRIMSMLKLYIKDPLHLLL